MTQSPLVSPFSLRLDGSRPSGLYCLVSSVAGTRGRGRAVQTAMRIAAVRSARYRFGPAPFVSKETRPCSNSVDLSVVTKGDVLMLGASPAHLAISRSLPRTQTTVSHPASCVFTGEVDLHRTADTRMLSADKSAPEVVLERNGPAMGQAKAVSELVVIDANDLVEEVRDQIRNMNVVPINLGRILQKSVRVFDRATFADNRVKLARTCLHDVVGIRTIDGRCKAADTDVRDFDFGPEAA